MTIKRSKQSLQQSEKELLVKLGFCRSSFGPIFGGIFTTRYGRISTS